MENCGNFIKNVRFDKSYFFAPRLSLYQFSFVGRSNVGKSSLINSILSRHISKVSKTPGKTIAINTFIINELFYLVDLPGYGYAKKSKSTLKVWSKEIDSYLKYSDKLLIVYVLIDSRHNMTLNDKMMFDWLLYNKKTFEIIFTKTDKANQKALSLNINFIKNSFNVPYYLTSIKTRKGIDDICTSIKSNLQDILT